MAVVRRDIGLAHWFHQLRKDSELLIQETFTGWCEWVDLYGELHNPQSSSVSLAKNNSHESVFRIPLVLIKAMDHGKL
jgi:hypothetical protein